MASRFESFEPRRLLSAGSLDASFGSNGVQFFPGSAPAKAYTVAAATMPGGGTLLLSADGGNGSGTSFIVSRLRADGSPDITFGQNGSVTITPFDLFSKVRLSESDTSMIWDCQDPQAIAVDAQGRIYIAANGPNADAAVDRLLPDGTVDRSFGDQGGVDLNPTLSHNALQLVTSMLIAPDGDVYLGGCGLRHGKRHQTLKKFAVERVLADGTVDASFGTGGVAEAQFYQSGRFLNATVSAMAFDAAGNILAAGGDDAQWDEVARFTPTGTLDASFGSHGEVRFRGASGALRAVAVSADGEVFVGGGGGRTAITADDTYRGGPLLVAALTPRGRLDPQFGSSGVVGVAVGDRPAAFESQRGAQVTGLAVAPDGGLDVVGSIFATRDDENGIVLARLNADGTADEAFAAGLTTAFPGGRAPAGWRFLSVPQPFNVKPALSGAAAEDAGGNLLLPFAGLVGRSAYAQPTLFRLTAPDGALDRHFGRRGMAQAPQPQSPTDAETDVLVAGPAGYLRVTQDQTQVTTFALNTSPQPSVLWQDRYDSGNQVVAAQPDGKILMQSFAPDSSTRLTRLNADGSVDATFGTGGTVTFPTGGTLETVDTRLTPGGNLLVALLQSGDFYGASTSVVTLYLSSPTGQVVASKLLPSNGNQIPGFAVTSGVGAALTDDGRVIEVVDTSTSALGGATPTVSFSVTRLNPDLTTDTTFGNAGTLALPVNEVSSVRVQPGGRILIGGNVGLVAVTPGGAIDTAFGQNGQVSTPDLSRDNWTVQSDGKILVASVVRHVLRVQRLNADGSVDMTFGDGGAVTLYVDGREDADSLPRVAIQQTADGEKLLVSGAVQWPGRNGGKVTPYVVRLDL